MKVKKLHIALISCILVLICGFVYCSTTFINAKNTTNTQVETRTIEVKQNSIDYESISEEFEDAELKTEGSLTTFEGTKTFDLADFDELDLVSDTMANESSKMQVQYKYSYDNETNMVTLTATMGDDGEPLIDTMYGISFVNEKGELDAVFDCDDGEYITLSELQNADMIANCGWFKRAFKQVANAVKKVCNTTIGKIGAVLTVAVPAVIGVVCAVATAPVLPVIVTGALVGAGIATGTTAISSYQQDGKVDWESVGICAGIGTAVGALSAGIAYGFTKIIKDLTNARIYSIAFAVGTSPLTICSSKLNYIEALSVLAAYKVSATILESYGLKLIHKNLFTSAMTEMLNLLKNNNIGGKYLGVYTPLKTDAAKLAFVLGGVEDSAFDLAHSTGGYYQHYHDKKHIIHVWYGSPF